MQPAILTFHVLIVLGLIVMVLLQRSEGGALGIGGGGGGGFMTGRGAANALTRTTSFLAAIFFATSLGLAIIAGTGESDETAIEELTGEAPPAPGAAPAAPTTEDLLQSLGGEAETDAAASESEAASGAADPAALLDALGRESAPDEAAAEGPQASQPAGEGADEPDAPDEE